MRSHHLEAMREGIAVVDKNGVIAGDPCPAGDARLDCRLVADPRLAFDATLKQATDDALMHVGVAGPELALGGKLRHARRGAGAARRTVDRLVAVEDGVAAMRLGVARFAR